MPLQRSSAPKVEKPAEIEPEYEELEDKSIPPKKVKSTPAKIEPQFDRLELSLFRTCLISHLSAYKKAATNNPDGKTGTEYKELQKLLEKTKSLLQ